MNTEFNVGGDLIAGNIVVGDMVNVNPHKLRVILESPYAGVGLALQDNIYYAREALRDSLLRDEAPIASHLLYTQPGVLDDTIPDERQRGIDAGLAWRFVADATVVYMDRGISKGMQYGIQAALEAGRPVYYRRIPSSRWHLYDTGVLN